MYPQVCKPLFLFCHRSARTEGAAPRGAPADEDHRLPARAHAGRRRRRRRAALQPRAGRAARAALAVRAGHAAHLLPEAGGPGAGAAAHREHVPRQPPLLGLRAPPRGPLPPSNILLLLLEPSPLFL